MKRNDGQLNSHMRVMSRIWRANTDIKIILDAHDMIYYACKYQTKAEKKWDFMNSSFVELVKNQNQETNITKVWWKLMMKALPQIDIGSQEVAMINLQLPIMAMRIRHIIVTDRFE